MGLGSSFGITSEINNNIQTDGLVLYVDAAYKKSYPRAGTTWYDLSGNGNNGTLTNTPRFDADGFFDFGDNTSYALFDGTFINNLGNNFSVFAWIWPNDLNINGTPYLGKWKSSDAGWGFEHHSNLFRVARWTGSWGGFNSTYTFVIGAWNYVGFTYDNSTFRAYGQGKAAGTEANDTGITSDTTSFSVGKGSWNGSVNETGSYVPDPHIGIVKIYNRALSAGEVLQNYNAQKERFGY